VSGVVFCPWGFSLISQSFSSRRWWMRCECVMRTAKMRTSGNIGCPESLREREGVRIHTETNSLSRFRISREYKRETTTRLLGWWWEASTLFRFFQKMRMDLIQFRSYNVRSHKWWELFRVRTRSRFSIFCFPHCGTTTFGVHFPAWGK